MDTFCLLLKVKFGSFGIYKLEDLVSSLFHNSEFREILISHNDIGSFEVEISSWLETSWLESNVRKNSSWESIRVEVLNLTVVKFES